MRGKEKRTIDQSIEVVKGTYCIVSKAKRCKFNYPSLHRSVIPNQAELTEPVLAS
jgi:hypothetical protein